MFKHLLVSITLLLAYAGCGKSASIGGDSETHFLLRCSQTCAGGLSCVCGICTKECSDDSSICSELAEGARCLSTLGDTCQEGRQLCDVVCERHSDCSDLGDAHRCESGVCRGTPASSTVGAGGTTSSSTTSSSTTGAGGAGGGPSQCCLASELSWGVEGGIVAALPQYSLTGCRTFQQDHPRPESSCENELPCEGEPGRELELTPDDINQLLERADVRTALEQAPTTYGYDSRVVDGSVLLINVDGREIVIGSPCSAGDQDCVPSPAGVEALRQALDQLVMQQITWGSCEQESLCSQSIEVGPCDADLARWFFNPDTHRCEEFSYGGCEGNDNNFESRTDCERACDNDPCSYGVPAANSGGCDAGWLAGDSGIVGLESAHCFETEAQACECACYAEGGSLDDCETKVVLDVGTRQVTCTPPG